MDREMLYDKIYGCWLGKNIGGTLGGPLEGQRNPDPLPFEFPELNKANDDLDLQMVWLKMLNEKGVKISSDDFMPYWINNITYPWDEYAAAVANIRRGLKPPQTGFFNNPFYEAMGSPIRSEIWACICPGMPDTAGWYAWQDAQLDHYDEGVYGEIFFSVMESLAFTENNIETVISEALEYLPESSEIKRAGQEVLRAWHAKEPLVKLRDTLISRYDRGNVTHCLINIAFTAVGLLYGEMDFLKSIVLSINLGYDTDCVGATVGAVLGIMQGKSAIVGQYNLKFDDKIVLGWGVTDVEAPANIDELTVQTIALYHQLLNLKEPPKLPKSFELPFLSDCPFSLQRDFLVSSQFENHDAALKALHNNTEGFNKITSPKSDIVDLSKYKTDGKPIYIVTRIKVPKSSEVSVLGTDTLNYWIDGKYIRHCKGGENERIICGNSFTPCPVRVPPEHRSKIYDGAEIIAEIFPESEQNLFAIMVSDSKMNHVVEAEYIA